MQSIYTWAKTSLFIKSLKRTFYEVVALLKRLLNLEIDIKQLQKAKKIKAIIGVFAIVLSALAARLLIKGHYQTLWIWFALAFLLALVSAFLVLWIIEFYTTPRYAVLLASFPFNLVLFYLFALNLFMDFSIRRIAFASVYLLLLGFFAVMLYAVFMATNIVNVSFFKKLLLSRLAERVLMFEALLISVSFAFIIWQYLVDGYFMNLLNLSFLAVFLLALGLFWISVTFYFFRDFKVSLAFSIVFMWGIGVVSALLLILGVSFIKVVVLSLFATYLAWETFELGDKRTRPLSWLILTIGFLLVIWLFLGVIV